jgi:hypothetical protein
MDSSDEDLLAYLEEPDSDADSAEEEETRKLHAKRDALVQQRLRRKLAGLPAEPEGGGGGEPSDDEFGLSSDDEAGKVSTPPAVSFVCGSWESSRAWPPHRPREDGLAHPADTSRSNLAAALGLLSRWLSKPFPSLTALSWMDSAPT